MNSLGSIFAENQTVVALANFGGIVGLLIVASTAMRRFWKIGGGIWTSNISVAIERYRNYRAGIIRVSARDIYLYTSEIARFHNKAAASAGVCLTNMITLWHVSSKSKVDSFDGYLAFFGAIFYLFFLGNFFFIVNSLQKFPRQVDDARVEYLVKDGSSSADSTVEAEDGERLAASV